MCYNCRSFKYVKHFKSHKNGLDYVTALTYLYLPHPVLGNAVHLVRAA